MSDFDRQLEKGRASEDGFVELLKCKSARRIVAVQACGDSSGDLLVVTSRGDGVLFEVKDDSEKSSVTGNIMLETHRTAGRYYKEPSGLAVSVSKWWIHKAWHDGRLVHFCALTDELRGALLHEVEVDAWDPDMGVVKRYALVMRPEAVLEGLCKDCIPLCKAVLEAGNPPTLNIRCRIGDHVVKSMLWSVVEDMDDGSWDF